MGLEFTPEVASDTYGTPESVLEPVRRFWSDVIDLDPFHDPNSIVGARRTIDVRKGGDGYTDSWMRAPTVWVNGPYSGDHPKRTAAVCARRACPPREILNLCPAAPGSTYWREWVWPYANAIAWLGRLSFRAGRRMELAGRVVEPGALVHGNRTEIALVYHGVRPYQLAACFNRWQVTPLRVEVVRP